MSVAPSAPGREKFSGNNSPGSSISIGAANGDSSPDEDADCAQTTGAPRSNSDRTARTAVLCATCIDGISTKPLYQAFHALTMLSLWTVCVPAWCQLCFRFVTVCFLSVRATTVATMLV